MANDQSADENYVANERWKLLVFVVTFLILVGLFIKLFQADDAPIGLVIAISAIAGMVILIPRLFDLAELKISKDGLIAKINQVDGKVDQVDGKVNQVEGKVDQVDGKVDEAMEEIEDLDALPGGATGLAAAVSRTPAKLDDKQRAVLHAMNVLADKRPSPENIATAAGLPINEVFVALQNLEAQKLVHRRADGSDGKQRWRIRTNGKNYLAQNPES